MRLGGRLLAVIALCGLAGAGCSDAGFRPASEADFLDSVRPQIIERDVWDDDRLLEGARHVCAELARERGDWDSVVSLLLTGVRSEGLSDSEMRVWLRDVSSIAAGAGTYICPEWESALPR